MEECAASLSMPSEPVDRPVSTFSSVMPLAASTLCNAAPRLAAEARSKSVCMGLACTARSLMEES